MGSHKKKCKKRSQHHDEFHTSIERECPGKAVGSMKNESASNESSCLKSGYESSLPSGTGSSNSIETTVESLPNLCEKLLSLESDESCSLVLDLHNSLQKSIESDSLVPEVMRRLLKVIALGLKSNNAPKELLSVMITLLESKFFGKSICRPLAEQSRDAVGQDVVEDLVAICSSFMTKMSDKAVGKLSYIAELLCIKVLKSEMQNSNVSEEIVKNVLIIERYLLENGDTKGKQDSKFLNDFRKLSIFPCVSEIIGHIKTDASKTVPISKYKNVDSYLETQFRLQRNTVVDLLRRGVYHHLTEGQNACTTSIHIYTKVKFNEPVYKVSGVHYLISFDVTTLGGVDWEASHRLTPGSLLCFSSDNFQTAIFGVVTERDSALVQDGKIIVKLERGENGENLALDQMDPTSIHVMIDTQHYFEVSRCLMKRIQETNSERMPFKNYIVYDDRYLCTPRYLDRDSVYDISCILAKQRLRQGRMSTFHEAFQQQSRIMTVSWMVSQIVAWLTSKQNDDETNNPRQANNFNICILHSRCWPNSDELGLDDSQNKAMQLALTSSLAVVQGLPGTGKTYLLHKIVKVLLGNQNVWTWSGTTAPILLVFDNSHVLDLFLNEVVSYTSNVVRIAGYVGVKDLDCYNIHNLVDENNVLGLQDLVNQLASIRGQIEKQKVILRLLCTHVLHERKLEELPGIDGRLVALLTEGFPEVFGVNPTKHVKSFLAAWLGLTFDDYVSQEDIELFYYYDERYFQESSSAMPAEKSSSMFIDVQTPNRPSIPQTEATCPDAATQSLSDRNKLDHCKSKNKDGIDEGNQHVSDISQDVAAISFNSCSTSHQNFIDDDTRTDTYNEHKLELDNQQPLFEDNTPIIEPAPLPITQALWALHIQSLSDPFYSLPADGALPTSLISQLTDKGNLRRAMAERELLIKTQELDDTAVKTVQNPWNLPLAHRWSLYRRWLTLFRKASLEEIGRLYESYNSTASRIKERKQNEEIKILQSRNIVAMTTTGAMLYQEQIKKLDSNIVILDDALQLPDRHILSILPPSAEHVILFGDCLPNWPNAAFEETTGNDHEVTLFERLMRNGLQHATLDLQHRMIPEISQLLSYVGYGKVEDHTTVQQYSNIKGITSNVFFINHNDYAGALGKQVNQFEAQFIVGLCIYLKQQKYEAAKITILGTCREQLRKIRGIIQCREGFQETRVAMVNDYRGEENDIVLLSFTFNKKTPNIGIYETAQYISLSLSRARKGLYCFGNFTSMAKQSDIWKHFVEKLERDEIIGPKLELVCQNHPDNKRQIGLTEEFQTFSPNGGCLKVCSENLPCGHTCQQTCHLDAHLKCLKVLKAFPNCNHSVLLPCSQDVTGVKCTEQVERVLKCSHKVMLECHTDIKVHKCTVKVKRVIPHCGHQMEMYCHSDPFNVKCEKECKFRLECGHQCPRTCHVMYNPTHEEVICVKPCQRKVCDQHHKCIMRCCEPCNIGKCSVLVEKKLKCGHLNGNVPCCQDPNKMANIICYEKCERFMACGHPCRRLCSDLCGGCKVEVPKRIPKCGHVVNMSCDCDPAQVVCNQKCSRVLPCRHFCTNKCRDPCIEQCNQLVWVDKSCGHFTMIACPMKQAFENSKSVCEAPCTSLLPCEHQCKGTCEECYQGRVHTACNEKCNRLLICGHPCETPCAQTCVPCKRSCANRCIHSFCPQKCGQPCKRCLEPCPWSCSHYSCDKLCGELCTRPRCDEPCTQTLPCGHACVGLCGEPCPSLCRLCDSSELTEFVLSGLEGDDTARFISIEECGHCIEVTAMDQWMDLDGDSVQMKGCPRCKTTIWYNPRYNNIIRTRLSDVQKVKKKIFGSKKKLKDSKIQLQDILKIKCINDILFKEEVLHLQLRLSQSMPLHQYELAVLENQINMLELMVKMKEKTEKMVKDAKECFVAHIKLLAQRLMKNEERITEHELKEIISEIRRIFLTAAVINTEKQIALSTNARCAAHLAKAKKTMFQKNSILTPKEEKQVEDDLEAAMNHRGGLGITDAERVQITIAMGFKPGHWFKCPNGHIYAIANCGGAMEIRKCNECGEKIGGERHTLLTGNAHAGEMDGSQYPAWSEEANQAYIRRQR